jgi:rifampicin phosphotransferase
MMDTNFTQPLNYKDAKLEVLGGKAASLARMSVASLPVPPGFCVTTHAYRCFVAQNGLQPRILESLEVLDSARPETFEAASQAIARMFKVASIPAEVAETVRQAYETLPGRLPAVAVRSSATVEDLPEASFAGQQETYLNRSGVEAVLEGIRSCWASLWTARAISYRARHDIPPGSVAMAVVVQLLVDAEASGILFTANPLHGSRDQMVANASWGLGEAVVGGLVTPDTLVIEKDSGKVVARQTAEKLLQIVRVEGGIQEQPVPGNLRKAPVLDDRQAEALVRLGNQIEALYGLPMDIEWALAGGEFSILQARPITALPEAEPSPPTSWKLPKGAYAVMRNNIVELMADPLTPLFQTLGLRAVNRSISQILTRFLGDASFIPQEPIITINEYAYYNGSVKFGPMVKIFLHSRWIMKQMFTGAVERWTEEGRPRYVATMERWYIEDWRRLPTSQILSTAQGLAEAAIGAYLILVSGLIPAAWMSEGFFTLVHKLVRRKGDPGAPAYLMGFDSLPICAEKALYDLALWAGERKKLAAFLKATTAPQIVDLLSEKGMPGDVKTEDWNEWQNRFQSYLKNYGHTIYNLDFGSPVPADDPAPVLETFQLFLKGKGVSPYERQKEAARRREQLTEAMEKRLTGLRLRIFQRSLERAQRYAPLREDGLGDVGLAYPLLRQMLVEIGQRILRSGGLEKAENIFWLREEEVRRTAAGLDQGNTIEDFSNLVRERKAIWKAARRVEPPMFLPQMKIFGIDLMQLKKGRSKGDKANILKGVPASPGSVSAPACVVNGPEDFARMRAGDVLVAPLTTPAWTILFARASAVVTDVGGPLSHGSIVAREYGIPAVLGTGGATRRIRSGQQITVDGSAGTVILEPL